MKGILETIQPDLLMAQKLIHHSALLPPDSCSASNGKCEGGHSPVHSGQVLASQKSSSQLALIGTFVDSLGREASD